MAKRQKANKAVLLQKQVAEYRIEALEHDLSLLKLEAEKQIDSLEEQIYLMRNMETVKCAEWAARAKRLEEERNHFRDLATSILRAKTAKTIESLKSFQAALSRFSDTGESKNEK